MSSAGDVQVSVGGTAVLASLLSLCEKESTRMLSTRPELCILSHGMEILHHQKPDAVTVRSSSSAGLSPEDKATSLCSRGQGLV